jgi:hypothetical protein
MSGGTNTRQAVITFEGFNYRYNQLSGKCLVYRCTSYNGKDCRARIFQGPMT